MAAKAKAGSTSCLSFLKDALLLPTQNIKLFIPVFLLVAVSTFLLQLTSFLHIAETNNTTSASSVDYTKLRRILKEEPGFIKITISVVVTIFVIIVIFAMIIGFACDFFAFQIVPLFAASTTYSGDRHSLPELFTKVIFKGRRLRGPLITSAMVTILDIACKAPLESLSLPLMPHLGVLYMAALSALPFLAFRYLDVIFVVAIAVSVANMKRRGVSALCEAWRLMTRKEGFVLVVVHVLTNFLSSQILTGDLAYSKESVPMRLALLSVCALLSGLIHLLFFAAVTVYYHQAVKIKEVMAP